MTSFANIFTCFFDICISSSFTLSLLKISVLEILMFTEVLELARRQDLSTLAKRRFA